MWTINKMYTTHSMIALPFGIQLGAFLDAHVCGNLLVFTIHREIVR